MVFLSLKKSLDYTKKIGLVLLLVGLVLFFNDKLDGFQGESRYLTGVLLSLAGSLIWVAYGMAQKLMLRRFSSPQILLMIYFGCLLVFTPVAEFSQVRELSPLAFGCLVYCCLNTLFGYGAYAEALNRWEVSKVSVVITLVPLFTIFLCSSCALCEP